jgi:hypothetical protein
VFKKTLIALSVGAALGSVNANAVTFSFTPNAWTTEGAEIVDNFVVPDIEVTLGAEYSKDDVIVFTFDADVTGDFNPTIDVALAAGNSGSMTLGFVNADANTVTYRVTELSAATGDNISTVGAKFTLEAASADEPNLVVGDQVRSNGGLTATYAATTGISQLPLDGTSGGAPVAEYAADGKVTDASLVTFATQYATVKTTVAFNGVIDVDPALDAERTVFVVALEDGSDTNVTDDSATIMIAEGTATNVAKTTGMVVKLAGNFSFIQDGDATKAGVQPKAGVLTAVHDGTTVSGVLNSDLTEATFTWATSELDDVTVTFDNANNRTATSATTSKATVIERGSFDATVTASYVPVKEDYEGGAATYDADATTGDGRSKVAGTADAGEFTLNGANVTVYAMPVGTGISNFLYVTNAGSQDAEVSMTATLPDGSSIVANDIATAGGKSITNIREEVVNALAAEGFTRGRATVEFTLNAPSCNIVVSAGYNARGDRYPLETSQTLDGKCDQ